MLSLAIWWQSEKCDAEFGDLVYCVFDTDTDPIKQREIDEAIRQAGRSNVEIVLSNPCFEVWFILHFGYTSKQFQSNEEVLRELRKNIPDYEKISESMKSISRNGPMRSTMDSAKERRRRCDDKVNLKCRN